MLEKRQNPVSCNFESLSKELKIEVGRSSQMEVLEHFFDQKSVEQISTEFFNRALQQIC